MNKRGVETLRKRINVFLSERKEPVGGKWPEVTKKELDALYDIVDRLISLKYPDYGGDMPIQTYLRDRTKEEPYQFQRVPIFPTNIEAGAETWWNVIRDREKALVTNVRIAADALDMHYKLRGWKT